MLKRNKILVSVLSCVSAVTIAAIPVTIALVDQKQASPVSQKRLMTEQDWENEQPFEF